MPWRAQDWTTALQLALAALSEVGGRSLQCHSTLEGDPRWERSQCADVKGPGLRPRLLLGQSPSLEIHKFSLQAYSDLLGLISTIAGYYGQENAALMFNGLTGSIHTRANALKLNIQLKLLQTGVDAPETSGSSRSR